MLCAPTSDGRFIKPPPDDCPGVFEYLTRRNDLYKYAVVTIAHPPPLGTTLDLVVRISIEGRLFKVAFAISILYSFVIIKCIKN